MSTKTSALIKELKINQKLKKVLLWNDSLGDKFLSNLAAISKNSQEIAEKILAKYIEINLTAFQAAEKAKKELYR